ncbi:MAG: LysM peptidoglycan-binding domain-containing protein [Bacteroidota bacterium]
MKQRKVLLLLILIFCATQNGSLFAQTTKDTSGTTYSLITIKKDNPIAAALDSLALLTCFENYAASAVKIQNKYNYASGYVPAFADSIYTERIAKLNSESPFGLVYNEDVKSFIDLYAVKKRMMTQRLMGMAQYYFPLFEEYLDKYHIPLELKYLAVVESALNPVAKSPAGAGGLWQFIYSTGKMYDLQVTSYVDDRFDPVKSTIAACEHFNDLYAIYKDWSLVLAAYNSGPGNVNNAIRKASGEMDFWKIKKYLPKETQGYVPCFIAVLYVMNYAEEHNLYAIEPDFKSYEIDTVTVKLKLTFEQISEALDIPLDDITYLNPTFKENIIPAYGTDYYTLYLPKKYIGDFVTNEDSLYVYKTKAMLAEEKLLADKKKKDSIANAKNYTTKTTTKTTAVSKTDTSSDKIYTVKAGDGLGIIAEKYNTTIAKLQAWNSLTTLNIYPGQKLYVQDPSVKDSSVTAVDNNTKTTTSASVKYVYHTVVKGDTLWDIAGKYKGTTVEEIKKLNNLTGKSILYIGQKLKIAVAS